MVSRHGMESDISCQGIRFFQCLTKPRAFSTSSPTLLVHDHSREILRIDRGIITSWYSIDFFFFFFFLSFREKYGMCLQNLFWDCRFQYCWLAALSSSTQVRSGKFFPPLSLSVKLPPRSTSVKAPAYGERSL